MLNTSTIQNIEIACGIGKIVLVRSYLVSPRGVVAGALHLGQSLHQVGGGRGEVFLRVNMHSGHRAIDRHQLLDLHVICGWACTVMLWR